MRTYAWIQHRHTHDRDSANVLSRRRSQPGVTSAIVRSLRHVTSPRRHAARVGRVGRVEAELLAMASRPNSGMKVEGEIRLSLTLLNIVRARDEPGLAVPMKNLTPCSVVSSFGQLGLRGKCQAFRLRIASSSLAHTFIPFDWSLGHSVAHFDTREAPPVSALRE